MAILALIGTIKNYSPIPFWDEWPGSLAFYHRVAVGDYLAWWHQHCDHRIVFARAIFWLDYRFFGGRDLFSISIDFMLQLGIAGVLSREFLRNSHSAGLRLFGVGVIFSLLLSWVQMENLTWGFQSQFIGVYFFAMLASISLSRAPETRRHWPVLAALGFAALTECSMANGIMIFPVLAVQAWLLRRPLRDILVIILTMAAAWALYFFHYVRYRPVEAQIPLIRVPYKLLAYFLTFMGNPAYYVTNSKITAAAIGLFTLVAMIWLAVRKIRARQVTPYRSFLIGLYLFCILSAVSATVSRFEFGIYQSLSSRYTLPTLLSWTILFMFSLDLVSARAQRIGVIGLASIAVAGLAWFQPQALHVRPGLFERKLAVLSDRIGLARPDLMDQIMPTFYRISFLRDDVAWVIQHHAGIYGSLPWLRAAGDVKFSAAMEDDTICAGLFDLIGRDAVGPTAFGWAASKPASDDEILILLVNGQAETIGYGLTGSKRPDVRSVFPAYPLRTGWTGFLEPTNGPVTAYAYLQGRFCKLAGQPKLTQ